MEYNYPINILFVHDPSESLTDIEAVMKDENYNIVHSYSSDAAIQCIAKDEFALIILDADMPGFNGFETAKLMKLHEKSISVPILFITDKIRDIKQLFTGYSIGVIDYMVKPFIPELLNFKINGFVTMYDTTKKLQIQTSLLNQRSKELEELNKTLMMTTTELILTEAQARIVGETSIDTMIIFDVKGMIISSNPAVFRMFGYLEDDLVGQSICSLLPMISYHSNELFRVNEYYLVDDIIDVQPMHKDGTTFYAEIQIGQAKIEDNLIYACTISDITKRKKAEHEMLKAKEEAELASRIKTDFLAIMSHEIRTPMNGIMGMTDLLMESRLSLEQKEFTEIIRKSSDSLLNIINDILDFSKFESGKMELDEAPLELHTLVEETFDLFKAKTLQKGLSMEFYMDQRLPLCILGDFARLRQILNNLVGNAAKFTDQGSILVLIHLTEQYEKDLTVEFIVKDTGIGIASEQTHRLFKPFSQLDSSMCRKYGGTGLGLAICKTLAELMGGSIRYERDADKGAIFVFSISTKAIDYPEALKNKVNQIIAKEKIKSKLAPIKIGLAEKMGVNQKLLHMLQKLGHVIDIETIEKHFVSKVIDKGKSNYRNI